MKKNILYFEKLNFQKKSLKFLSSNFSIIKSDKFSKRKQRKSYPFLYQWIIITLKNFFLNLLI